MSQMTDLPDEEAGRRRPLVPRVEGQRSVERASGLTTVAVIFAVTVFV